MEPTHAYITRCATCGQINAALVDDDWEYLTQCLEDWRADNRTYECVTLPVQLSCQCNVPHERDLLTQVLTSSVDLVARFDGTLTERGSFAKFNEESDELKKAIYMLMASPQAHPQLMAHVAEELADVLITAAGMACYSGVPIEVLLPVIRTKLAKNAAKTTETHRWDDESKTVVRVEKTP